MEKKLENILKQISTKIKDPHTERIIKIFDASINMKWDEDILMNWLNKINDKLK